MTALLLLAAIWIAGAPDALADDRALLDEALTAYAAGLDTPERDARLARFRRSEALFGRLLETGHDTPDLHANLANAALQSERLGVAILHYRRALGLAPGHARAQQNLEFARAQLPAWVPRPASGGVLDTFFFWHRTLSRAHRGLAAGVAFLLGCTLVALALRFDSATPRNLALLPGAAWVALVASLMLDPAAAARDEAVITAERVVARSADSELAPPLLPSALPAGAEVRIVERRSPWLRVRLANGRDVWVPESSATALQTGRDVGPIESSGES
ncbi:MAG: hypothetical protein JRG76_10075 [Deltaproteobacteria bacterium]|nr:hypothetical protein [Deltaproteobacteria bacterium]MBW2414842.1 hypothetical protein [Deltaproteobacteria bacterium]